MALTPAEKQDLANKIAAAKAQIPTLEADINKAHLAGIDVKAMRDRLTELKNQVRLLEQHYGTGA